MYISDMVYITGCYNGLSCHTLKHDSKMKVLSVLCSPALEIILLCCQMPRRCPIVFLSRVVLI